MPTKSKSAPPPSLRFPEFQGTWTDQELGHFLTESRIPGNDGSVAKKLTVKLWGNGVVGKTEAIRGSSNTQYYKRKAGQFIYSKLDFLNQAFGIIPESLDGFESTVDLPCFDVGAGLNPRFLLEYVQRRDFYKRLGELADGGRKARRVQVESFLSFPIAVPSDEEEQQKIADCLASLDEVIAAQGRKVEALKAHKWGLMQQLFPREGESVPCLRVPQFREGPAWGLRELGPMTSKVGSGITPLGGEKNYKTEGRPFVRSQNIGWGELILGDVAYIDEETHRTFDATEIKDRDVLLNITGASIGRSAVADARIVGGNVNQHVCIIRLNPIELNPVLLNQYLLSDRGQKQIDTLQAGGNRQGLNFGQIRSLQIPLPPTQHEQEGIADCLSSVDDQVAVASRKRDALKAHKKGLSQQLFPLAEESL